MDADKEGQIGSRDLWSANLRSSAATSFGCMAMEQGNLKVGLGADGLDLLVNRFERISNRIVLGVIAAAFINGFAVLLSVYHPPGLERWAWALHSPWDSGARCCWESTWPGVFCGPGEINPATCAVVPSH